MTFFSASITTGAFSSGAERTLAEATRWTTALDDADETMGCLQVIPGSHQGKPILPF